MTDRPPFDPRRIRKPPASERNVPGINVLSVRQVNDLVSGALAAHVPSTLHVLGEISNLSQPSSGHLYFTLKDPNSELRCVMWRSTAAKLKFTPESGMEVIATGGIEVYAPRGTYQLMVRKLEPRGVGALEIAFRQLQERLASEGLFDADRKRPLPRIPQRVALVTSPSGAAVRDMIRTMQRRFPAIDVLLFPVRVQGPGAAEEIATAIRHLNTHAEMFGGIDVIIAGRGGGSIEDLWAFNEEVVARTIAASRIPLVSAVGHETDVCISDLVADVRAATPTAAAELVAPDQNELAELVSQLVQRATRGLRTRLDLARAELRAALACDGIARPTARVREQTQLLDDLLQRTRFALIEQARAARDLFNRRAAALLRLGTGVQYHVAARRLERAQRLLDANVGRGHLRRERKLTERLTRLSQSDPLPGIRRQRDRLAALLRRAATALAAGLLLRRQMLDARIANVVACDPRQVLRRGYSVTRDAHTRKLIRSTGAIRDGQRIITELADGEFRSTAQDPRQPELFD